MQRSEEQREFRAHEFRALLDEAMKIAGGPDQLCRILHTPWSVFRMMRDTPVLALNDAVFAMLTDYVLECRARLAETKR